MGGGAQRQSGLSTSSKAPPLDSKSIWTTTDYLSEKTVETLGKSKKRKLVCIAWLLDILTNTTNASKTLSIDFRVPQPQALQETTCPMQITIQKTYAMSIDRRWASMCHSWSKTPFHLISIFFAYDYVSTDYSSAKSAIQRQISEGRAMHRKRRTETRLVNWITVAIVTYHYDYNIVSPQYAQLCFNVSMYMTHSKSKCMNTIKCE